MADQNQTPASVELAMEERKPLRQSVSDGTHVEIKDGQQEPHSKQSSFGYYLFFDFVRLCGNRRHRSSLCNLCMCVTI